MVTLPQSLELNLKEHVDQSGLSAHYSVIRQAAAITFLMRVELNNDASGLPLGGSRLGGVPDLPSGWSWPVADESRNYGPNDRRFMGFVGQINFAEVPVLGDLLPKRGILFVFASIDSTDARIHRLRLHDGNNDDLVRRAAPSPSLLADQYGETSGTLCVRQFIPSVSLPDTFDPRRPAIPDELLDSYDKLKQTLHQDPGQAEPSSRLLGYPYLGWGGAPSDKWHLLLSVESYFGPNGCVMNIGDAGALSVFVPAANIAKADFTVSTLTEFSN